MLGNYYSKKLHTSLGRSERKRLQARTSTHRKTAGMQGQNTMIVGALAAIDDKALA